jgi:hypothetical protein
LGNPALDAEVAKTGGPVLKQALEWSKAVNRSIADLVEGVAPFPWFRNCAEKLARQADIICVSATPGEALEREWQEHDIAQYAAVIAGQEMGSQKEHLKMAAGGKYAKDCILMIGDGPGDLAAARANGALFFPINLGQEEQSWERFYGEGIDQFFDQTYASGYQASLIEEFEKSLPEMPPWKSKGWRFGAGNYGLGTRGWGLGLVNDSGNHPAPLICSGAEPHTLGKQSRGEAPPRPYPTASRGGLPLLRKRCSRGLPRGLNPLC